MQRIAINTGGGDAPDLNAVIRATVLAATNRGNPLEWECPQGGSSELGWMITGDLYSGGGAFSIPGHPPRARNLHASRARETSHPFVPLPHWPVSAPHRRGIACEVGLRERCCP